MTESNVTLACMKHQQQHGVGAAATQLPLLPAPQAQRAGHLSDSESHSGSAQSTRSPRRVPPPPQVMVPMQADRAPGHFLPAGNVPQMPAYGQPVQIPPGYAFVPAHPQMPVPSSFLLPSGLPCLMVSKWRAPLVCFCTFLRSLSWRQKIVHPLPALTLV